MPSVQEGLIREGPSGLPPDWGDWVGEEHLARLVERAVDAALGTGRGRVAASPGSLCATARLALRWLVYAYARGIYFSRDLEFFRSSQGDLLKPFSNAAPEPSLLRLIRRQYREFIELALAKVAECVWQETRADQRSADEYGGASYLESALDRWNPEPGETDFKRESVARVSRAVRADSMALDE